jgi:hypothetical protein
MSSNDLDARIAAADVNLAAARAGSVAERQHALAESIAVKVAKTAELQSRMDPATGQILDARQEVPAVSPSPFAEVASADLDAQVSAIEAELAQQKQHLTSMAHVHELRQEHAAVKRELRARRSF